jgi:hypothetical protein
MSCAPVILLSGSQGNDFGESRSRTTAIESPSDVVRRRQSQPRGSDGDAAHVFWNARIINGAWQ